MVHKNRSKCVLSICDIAPSIFGSFEEFLVDITDKLKEDGFEHVVVFRDQPIESVKEALLSHGAAIKIIKPSKYALFNFFKIKTLIDEIEPDIIHLHFYPIHTVINYLKYICNVKIVYTGHMGGKKAKHRLHKYLRKMYYYTNSKLFDSGIDKIVCVSDYVKTNYFKEYGIRSKKACIIYNGINISKYNKNLNANKLKEKYNISDEFVIACVGLRKDKGAHCLIKAAPAIIKQIPNSKFILVGEGERRSCLEQLVDELKLKDQVVFVGNVADLSDVYSISSCVVVPSLFEEAFCFVAAEAMAAGTPVVAFNSGALKEVIIDGKTGYILQRDNKLLADTIIKLYMNNEYVSMGENGKKLVKENFPIGTCTRKYVSLYTSLLN